jgi:hypothetical protein
VTCLLELNYVDDSLSLVSGRSGDEQSCRRILWQNQDLMYNANKDIRLIKQ